MCEWASKERCLGNHGRMPRSLRFTGEQKNITFDELEDFVKAARDAGVRGHEEITVAISSSGKIKVLEIEFWD